ncbi:MAG: hypothetical protein ACE5HS_18490 [bacterium]
MKVKLNRRRIPFFLTILFLAVSQLAFSQKIPGTMKKNRTKLAQTAASLQPFFRVTGRVSVSVDGVGFLGSDSLIQVNKPPGATVRKAFLAAASTGTSERKLNDGDVEINGFPVEWDSLQTTVNSIFSFNHLADVTAIVEGIVDSASAGRIDLSITEKISEDIDGEILVVVFDDENLLEDNTVILFFGAQDFAPDEFEIQLDNPLDFSKPELSLEMGLGISFSFQKGIPSTMDQFSTVSVNGSLLTRRAGGQDDGKGDNGALLTVGGLGDCDVNPLPNSQSNPSFRVDDELYNLKPFVSNGESVIRVQTINPSRDDNIFFAWFFLHFPEDAGEQILLQPATAANPLGAEHTVTATVIDKNGHVIDCGIVNITVVSGPNAGQSVTQELNENEPAFLAYTGQKAGTDSIAGYFVNSRGDTVRAKMVAKTWVRAPVCEVIIDSPPNDAFICKNSVLVTGTVTVTDGLPPFNQICTVNGIPVSLVDGAFSVTVPLMPGANSIEAVCVITDSLGSSTQCQDTITVKRSPELNCSVEIISPVDSTTVRTDSIEVSGVIKINQGSPPFTIAVKVNGFAASRTDSLFQVTVPLELGWNTLIAKSVVIDSCGNQTLCTDTVMVRREPGGKDTLLCSVTITAPADNQRVCQDSVQVDGVIRINGTDPPFAIECEVNGVPAVVSDTTFQAMVPLQFNNNLIIATCTIKDAVGRTAVCKDSIQVSRLMPPQCDVKIVSPQDSTVVTADSIEIRVLTNIEQGAPPLVVDCQVNGVVATKIDSFFIATVPLEIGENTITATSTVLDSCGFQSTCSDTITVFREREPLACQIEITTPEEQAVVCDSLLPVAGVVKIINGTPPFAIECEINSNLASVTDNNFNAIVPLTSGENQIRIKCTVTDQLGAQTVCLDTVQVIFDDIPPTCTFTDAGAFVTGTFTDLESGLFAIEAPRLRNATLTVDPFTPGQQTVSFRIDAIDPSKPKGFVLDGVDVCGNVFRCDPILFTLSTDQQNRQMELTFPAFERYLRISNHGLTEIQATLNGLAFLLLTSPSKVEQELNSYLLPQNGAVTMDLQNHLQSGENHLKLAFAGGAGSKADLMLIDQANNVDYVLEIRTLPSEFHLAQNFPNPFNPTTKIRFEIPERLTQGTRVRLQIFNLLGERLVTLVDEIKYPGLYTVEWDARDANQEAVATGIYIYRMVAEDFQATRRLILLK